VTLAGAGVRHPDLLAYRDEFALLARSTYLNTCSLGALSDRSRASLDRFLTQWDGLGARAWYRHWLGELAGLRDDFGALLGVPGAEIGLAPNVSTALATIASAIDGVHRGDDATLGGLRATGVAVGNRPRTRVITTALDFPTIGHQWLARAPLGVEVVTVASPDGLTVPLSAFDAEIDDRTAIVATGYVYFTTGAVQDVAGLARLAHERGALLVIDAYQATGLVPTDLGPSAGADRPDAYVSGTLKWLFGGPGTAFLWVRPELHDALRPTTTGWFSSARQFAFDGGTLEFAPDARRYELGTPSVPSAFIARGGLEVVREIGVARLRERTLDLGALTISLAEAAGLRVRAVRDDTWRGGIVAVEVTDPKRVVDELAARGIIVDFRPGIVRLSPAFYNTDDEVRGVVEALAELIPAADRA
jgi:selenocysteine lyase/cysteine desulfurase